SARKSRAPCAARSSGTADCGGRRRSSACSANMPAGATITRTACGASSCWSTGCAVTSTEASMRFVHIADHMGYGGSVPHGLTKYLLLVLPRLAAAGHDVAAIFLREPH